MSATPRTDEAWAKRFDYHDISPWSLCMKLEIELAAVKQELNEWKTLQTWGGTPQIVDEFIKGQQTRIYAAQDAEKQRDTMAEALDYIAHCGLSARHLSDYAKEAIAAMKGGSDE